MPRGRVAANDYTNCVNVMIPIPKDKFHELKLQCVKENVTMKEVLYDMNIESINKKLGVK